VDLSGIDCLDRLEWSSEDGLCIGARVTLARLAADARVRQHYPAIVEAALAVGTWQLQSMGTVGGNLCQDTCCMYVNRPVEQRDGLSACHKIHGDKCHVVAGSDVCWANYAGDLAPVLLALDATVRVARVSGEDTRSVPCLFTGDGIAPIGLAPGELVTQIDVPTPSPCSGASYLKLRQRDSLDYPLLGVAAVVTLAADGTCSSARLALTGVDRAPVVVNEAASLVGRVLDAAAVGPVAHAAYRLARPVKNAWGYGASYRAKMTRVYVLRAVASAAARAREAQ
jgi:4-hydroxybenzoyl-CoA reductase subunit beta